MCGITAAPNKNGAKSEQDWPRAKKGQEVWIPYHRSLLIVLTGVWSQTLSKSELNTNRPCERVANGRTTVNINSAFPSDYLKAADLNGKAVRVTIADVTTQKVGDDQKPVLHFVGKEKGLILNRTNANRIIEAVGSDETDHWAGWSIVLYPAKVDFQGKRVDAIRVDDRPGASKKPQATTVQHPPEVEDDIDIPSISDEPIPF